MAMAVGRTGQTAVKSEPNVVPMIDIMLVLLIIFMIVTPLIAAGFKATLPKGKNLDPARGRQRGGLARNRRGGPLFPQRAAASGGHPRGSAPLDLRGAATEDKILYFKADNQLKYGKIQEAVETARRAGVRVMAAITEPTSRSQRLRRERSQEEGEVTWREEAEAHAARSRPSRMWCR